MPTVYYKYPEMAAHAAITLVLFRYPFAIIVPVSVPVQNH